MAPASFYYFHNEEWPVLLLAVYAKNEKAGLSAAERNAMARVVAEIKRSRRA